MLSRTAAGCLLTSYPATDALPFVMDARVSSILIVVVLPAPFGPKKPKISPSSTSKEMSSTALTFPL